MPICKKCGNKFPNRIIIDGLCRNVNKRMYCLQCSPFGQHNTRLLSLSIEDRIYYNKNHVTQKRMKDRRKEILVEYKGGKCNICGYKKCLNAFDFHHINPEDKKFELQKGNLLNHSCELIIEEINKTILLCRNCHSEVHSGGYQEIEQKWKDALNFIDRTNESQLLKKLVYRKEIIFIECEYCKKQFLQYKKQKYCSTKCSSISQRKAERPSKEVLIKQIEELGYCGTGRLYNVSDNAIRKWVI